MATRDDIVAAFQRLGGNVSATARELSLARSTVLYHVRKAGADKKPLVGGSVEGVTIKPAVLPPPGQVKRYILTSAQNNTRLHNRVWENLLALKKHYNAELLVGTYSYNKNAYGALAVKRGSELDHDRELWYDARLTPYFSDERRELGKGLLWCGEMNIQPTSNDPLEGLETYSGRMSAIFPHAKHAMRSIAAMKGEGVKFNYTTGTVTQKNYIQKKAGLVAEHHHSYGAVLVEVDDRGHWWVRQLDADEKGRIYDLKCLADKGIVQEGNRVEAINWGDIHSATIDGSVTVLALGKGGMLEYLKPRVQFLHDVMEGVGTNHHGAKNCHDRFRAHLRGLAEVQKECVLTAGVVKAYSRDFCHTVVVDSNHDSQWLSRWLREHDYRFDPQNAIFFLEAQLATYKAMQRHDKTFNITEWAIRHAGGPAKVQFLREDESYKIAGGRVECGMHGHLGANGVRATPQGLSKIGRRANTGHTHSAGIYSGLYVAGTSTTLDMGYNVGPSSWSHSHIVTYPNGKRTIVTMYAGKWKA